MNFDIFVDALVSYLLGSIPVSYIVARFWGKNLFEIGSKNIGTANVWRATHSVIATSLALIGDAGKGILALYFTNSLDPTNLMICAFFVVLGHNFSIFLKFKGGRGLATLAGMLLYLQWEALIFTLLIVAFSILLVETIRSSKRNLGNNIKEITKNTFQILISQVLGRVIGIALATILIWYFFKETFLILLPAVFLSLLKHLKRLKKFLAGEKV